MRILFCFEAEYDKTLYNKDVLNIYPLQCSLKKNCKKKIIPYIQFILCILPFEK